VRVVARHDLEKVAAEQVWTELSSPVRMFEWQALQQQALARPWPRWQLPMTDAPRQPLRRRL